MAAPLTSSASHTPAVSSGTDTNFSERLQFGTVFYGLEQKGIHLTEEEKKRFEHITRSNLNHHDNSTFSGLGPSNIFYLLFAFIGNLLNGKGTTDFGNIGEHLSASNDRAVEMSKLRQLELASTAIYRDLKNEGSNLAAAAEYATGVSLKGQEIYDIPESVLNQLRRNIALAGGTSSSLAALDPRVQTDLPHKTRTQGLTPGG